jgi:hypothetical protein
MYNSWHLKIFRTICKSIFLQKSLEISQVLLEWFIGCRRQAWNQIQFRATTTFQYKLSYVNLYGPRSITRKYQYRAWSSAGISLSSHVLTAAMLVRIFALTVWHGDSLTLRDATTDKKSSCSGDHIIKHWSFTIRSKLKQKRQSQVVEKCFYLRYNNYSLRMWDIRFSRRRLWRCLPSGMLLRVV